MHYHQTVSKTGRIDCDWEKDADMENLNKETEAYSGKSEHSYENALVWCEHFQTLSHVDRVYRELFGLDVHTPIEARTGFNDTVWALIKWLEECLESSQEDPNRNPFTNLSMSSYDRRRSCPWEHIRAVAEGTAGPIGYPIGKKSCITYAWDYLHDNMPSYVVFQAWFTEYDTE